MATPNSHIISDRSVDQSSARIDMVIEQLAGSIAERIAGSYAALLLVGAAGRGEWTIGADGALLSDLDFLVVLPQRQIVSALLAEHRCRARLRSLSSMFTQLAPGGVSIGFANAAPRYWTVATPLMWELRTGARVLDGRDDVRLWPTIACAEQIPQWEGIRLVANRISELLGALADDAGSQDALATRRVRYACTKLALACSEAQLIDARRYQASYRARQQEHQYIADRFSPAQNQLLAAAYCAKLNGAQDEAADTLTTAIANTLDLAIATLNSLGLHSPADLAARTRAVSPAAPGYATDLCFFAMQCLQGHQVPPRRAIAPVYAQAIRLAREIAGNPAALQPGSHLADSCKRLYQAYKQAPQVVSIIRAGATV